MKRRFEFRLERLRRVRALEENVARAARAQAENEARAAEARADELRARLSEDRAHVRAELERGPDPAGLLGSHRALDATSARLRLRAETARGLRESAEQAAREHRQRKSAARALDELRERARLEHRAELERVEQAALDEAAQRGDTRREKVEGDSSAPGLSTDLASETRFPPRP